MTVSIPLSSAQFISVSLFLLFVFANGNVMTNYELATSNSNHVPVTAKYSRTSMNLRDQSYSRNYQYPGPDDDSLSNINNNWGGGRQMSSLAATSLQAPANNDYGFGGDNYASANEPGYNSHGSYGSGHKASVYVNNSAVGLLGFLSLLSLIQAGKSVCRLLMQSFIIGKGENCNSALGLLGVLGLASYLQNVLRQMTTTTARAIVVIPPGRRRKRDIITVQTAREFQNNQKEIDDVTVTDKMLPLLTAVGHARDGLIPLACTRRPVCLVNKLLLDELGPAGKPIGSQLSFAISMMLKEVDKLGIIEKMISKASQAGAAGKDCEQLYTSCPVLSRLPSYTVPTSMQM